MSRPIISAHQLGKRYQIGSALTHDTLRDKIAHGVQKLFRSGREDAEGQDVFWALKDVSFDLEQGDVVGIIGHNGAGKSTLLKVLSQITEPTEGEVRVRGRIASLLEVGTGFHPELSGRENIYLNGAILGMSKADIRAKFDEIVAFAEVSKFLDTPVKRYSSGMYVRLAFAVAAHLEPEILVVDEVLAVGDAGFQKKCMGKMENVARTGRTVLLVSHNMAAVTMLCNKGLLLERGKVVKFGDTQECIERYITQAGGRSGMIVDHLKSKSPALKAVAISVNGSPCDRLHLRPAEQELAVRVTVEVKHACPVAIHAFLKDRNGQSLAIYSPGHLTASIHPVTPGRWTIDAGITLPPLLKGSYFLDIGLSDPGVATYADAPFGLELLADGYPACSGLVFEQGTVNGCQVLTGSVSVTPCCAS